MTGTNRPLSIPLDSTCSARERLRCKTWALNTRFCKPWQHPQHSKKCKTIRAHGLTKMHDPHVLLSIRIPTTDRTPTTTKLTTRETTTTAALHAIFSRNANVLSPSGPPPATATTAYWRHLAIMCYHLPAHPRFIDLGRSFSLSPCFKHISCSSTPQCTCWCWN